MLGDGIVSFGTLVVTVFCRNEKSSPKIVRETPSGPSTCSAAGVNSSSPLLVEEPDRDVPGFLRDPVELVDEVHVPRGAAELAVGRRAEPDVLLHRHGLADRVVLDRAQLGGVDPARGEVLARLKQVPRPQQAADMVGPERGSGALRHDESLVYRIAR